MAGAVLIMLALGCKQEAPATAEVIALRAEIASLRQELDQLKKERVTELSPTPKEKGQIESDGRVLLEVLKVKGGLLGAAKQTEVAFRMKNESPLFIDTVLAQVDAYGAGDEYLGNCNESFMNVSAGKATVDSCTVLEVPLKRVERIHVQISIPTNDERIKALSLIEGAWKR